MAQYISDNGVLKDYPTGYPVYAEVEGIKNSNRQINRVEPLITPDILKKSYLFGVHVLDKETGEDLSDDTYQQFINTAVSMLEHDLDISILPQDIVEHKDFRQNEYWDWSYMMTNNVPVIKINNLQFVYMKDVNSQDNPVLNIPAQWLRIQSHDGVLRLIPNSSFPGNLQIGNTGAFFPEILRSTMIPHLWKIEYSIGFSEGKVPVLLNQCIAMIASILVLTVGGILILGAGISGSSVSIDGLSESIQTTQSSENTAYSAQIKQFQKLVFGTTEAERDSSLIKILRDYYRGETMSIL